LLACPAGMFAAEPVAEVLEPEDAPHPVVTPRAPIPVPPAATRDATSLPAPEASSGGEKITPMQDVPLNPVDPTVADDPTPVTPAYEINEPDFKAKVVYRAETAPNSEAAVER